MNELVLPEQPLAGARAWRVAFDAADSGPDAAILIREPHDAVVFTHPVEIDAALADSTDADDTSMLVIWLPTGDGVAADLERNLEAGLRGPAHDRPVLRASIRVIRVVWTDRRVVVYAPSPQWPDALDAVLRFTLMARETSTLEVQMKAVWTALDKHVPLSRALSIREGRLQSRVNEMTEMVTRMRNSYLRMQSAVVQTDLRLTSTSKRLCAELMLQAAIHDRLDVLDEPIEFAMNHYEIANTRLIEHRNASIEFVLMGLIIIGLFVQTIAMLAQEFFE
jgi:hypothetical protein